MECWRAFNLRRFIVSMGGELWCGSMAAYAWSQVQRRQRWPWGFRGSVEVPLNGDATAIRLRVIERRYVLLVRKGSMPDAHHGRGDATGGGTLPLPRCVYYTHILRAAELSMVEISEQECHEPERCIYGS